MEVRATSPPNGVIPECPLKTERHVPVGGGLRDGGRDIAREPPPPSRGARCGRRRVGVAGRVGPEKPARSFDTT
eukprot:8558005-Pyramimonas_sp.AAC.1